MSDKITNGFEFNNGNKIEGNPHLRYCKCQRCNKEIIFVSDNTVRRSFSNYQGNQAIMANHYRNSPIINKMREYYGYGGNVAWLDCPIANGHARIHSANHSVYNKARNVFFELCNDCFRKTMNRHKVRLSDGSVIAISVITDMHETVQSVMKDMGFKDGEWSYVGKGGDVGW